MSTAINKNSELTLRQKMSCCGLSHRSDTEPEKEHYLPGNRMTPLQSERPADTKRVVLSIEGLKCGCCGDGGISYALGQIPGVHNHHVNVVLARAEFDLDIRTTTVGMVRRKLTAVTGCTFKQYFQPDGQILEIVVDDPTEIYQVCESDAGQSTAHPSKGLSIKSDRLLSLPIGLSIRLH